jgi:hypothetical protein
LFYYVKLVFCLYYHVVRLRKHEHLRIWDEQYPNFQMPRMHLSRTEFSPFFTFTCVKERSERGGAETETGVLAVMVKGGLGFRKCFLSGVRYATPLPDSYVAKFSSTHVKICTRAPGRGPHLQPYLFTHSFLLTCHWEEPWPRRKRQPSSRGCGPDCAGHVGRTRPSLPVVRAVRLGMKTVGTEQDFSTFMKVSYYKIMKNEIKIN